MTAPEKVARPNCADWGPRRTSTRSTALVVAVEMLPETNVPSMKYDAFGSPRLTGAPMPRIVGRSMSRPVCARVRNPTVKLAMS